MTNLQLMKEPQNQSMSLEQKLRKMQDLDSQIKELQAHFTMLKEEVIIEHFSSNIEYKTSTGLLLATYKPIEIDRFQQKEFGNDYPELFSSYKKMVTEYRFLLKK